MKNKKIILLIVIGSLIFGFFVFYNSLQTHYENFYERKVENNYYNKKFKQIVFKIASMNYKFEFKKNNTIKKKLHNKNLLFKTFTLPFLTSTGPRSYLSYYNRNLFLITGTGILMYASLQDIKDEKFFFKKINTNYKNMASPYFFKEAQNIVNHLLIKNNKIYVSYEKKEKDKCFKNVILVADLDYKKITFNEFFKINECQPFFTNAAGGNLSDYNDNKILMTIGDYNSYESPYQANNNPQNINSLIGKVISIDEKTKNKRI